MMLMYPNFEYVLDLCERASMYGRCNLCEHTIVKFVKDLADLLYNLENTYQDDFAKMVQEQADVFYKFEKIATWYPEALDIDIFWSFLEDVLISGHLPHPVVYCKAKLIDESLMANVAAWYLEDKEVQQWIIDNWSECKKYKPVIERELHEQPHKLLKLVKLCHMHYVKKTLAVLLLVWLCGVLCWFNTAYVLVAFLMMGVFVFILREICNYFCAETACLRKDLIWR